MKQTVSSWFLSANESILFGIVMFLVIVGPIAFVPMHNFSIGMSKGFFVILVGIIGLIVYAITTLKRGVLVFPKGPLWTALCGIVTVGFIGSLFSPVFSLSFFGYGFETTTLLFTFVFGLIAFFAYRSIHSHERIALFYGGLLIPFTIIVIIQIIRYIAGPATANLGVMFTNNASITGSWGEFGIFLGFILLFAMITLELAGLKKAIRLIVGIVGGIAAVVLVFMNIKVIWITIGLVALMMSLYLFSFAYWDKKSATYQSNKKTPFYTLALFAIAVVAIIFGSMLNGLASRHQNIAFNDIRPSPLVTMKVFEKSVVHNFATGFGPNMFSLAWKHTMPASLSGEMTQIKDFDFGLGYIPTQIAATGILGAIAWLLFFIILVISIVKALTAGFEHAIDRYFTVLLAGSVVYLGIIAWVYVPGSIMLAIFAITIGIFLRLSYAANKKEVALSFMSDPRVSFFGILGISAIVVLAVIGGYIEIRKYTSFVHYTRAQNLLAENVLPQGESELLRAIEYANYDIYHIPLVQIYLDKVTNLISHPPQTATKESLTGQTNQLLGIALGHAQSATDMNSANYKNWITLGGVYQFMTSLGIAEAYDRGMQAYQEAQVRNPNDSGMFLYFAQIALAKKDTATALNFIQQSINQYPIADAYILRGQIEVSQNSLDKTIVSLKQAVLLSPYNSYLAYTYGILLFNTKDYTAAASAFEQSILVNRNFGEAYVYLGVTYERLGETDKATKVFDFIRTKSSDADTLIDKIRNGGEKPVVQATNPAAANTTTIKNGTKAPVAPKPKK